MIQSSSQLVTQLKQTLFCFIFFHVPTSVLIAYNGLDHVEIKEQQMKGIGRTEKEKIKEQPK